MADTLIVFIDGLGYQAQTGMPYVGSLPDLYPVRPGFGYSVNVHAELFAGCRPDDVGYFCEWMVDPTEAPGRRWRHVLSLLDTIFRPYVLNRGLQRLLTRGYRSGHVMPNIPLRHLDKFAVVGEHILSPRFPRPTLFSAHPDLYVLPYRGIARKGSRDEAVYQQARRALASHSRLFVPFPDLDAITHQYGLGSAEQHAHLDLLDGWIAELAMAFRQRYPVGHFFVVSDHGMAAVRGGIPLRIEDHCGTSGLREYLYFGDATLLRVWLYNEEFRQPLYDFLSGLPRGCLLDEDDRQQYGLTNPAFGDFIVVLEEGYCFEPSTFARHIPKAMHGYHPLLPSQWGVFAHEGPRLTGPRPQEMVEVYSVLRNSLQERI